MVKKKVTKKVTKKKVTRKPRLTPRQKGFMEDLEKESGKKTRKKKVTKKKVSPSVTNKKIKKSPSKGKTLMKKGKSTRLPDKAPKKFSPKLKRVLISWGRKTGLLAGVAITSWVLQDLYKGWKKAQYENKNKTVRQRLESKGLDTSDMKARRERSKKLQRTLKKKARKKMSQGKTRSSSSSKSTKKSKSARPRPKYKTDSSLMRQVQKTLRPRKTPGSRDIPSWSSPEHERQIEALRNKRKKLASKGRKAFKGSINRVRYQQEKQLSKKIKETGEKMVKEGEVKTKKKNINNKRRY